VSKLKAFWSWAQTGNRTIYFEYTVLALLVMLPLLRPGYIFALDMVFTPRFPLPPSVDNSYLYSALLHYLSFVIPSQVLQKIILLLSLVLSGVGMHHLVQHALGQRPKPNKGLTSAQLGCYCI
jgi:hypothetical protein